MYASGMPYRDMAYVPLSSSGQMTITNQSCQRRGRCRSYDPRVFHAARHFRGGRTVCAGRPGHRPRNQPGGTALAANASVTFQVSGTAGLPRHRRGRGLDSRGDIPRPSGRWLCTGAGGLSRRTRTMNFQAMMAPMSATRTAALSRSSPSRGRRPSPTKARIIEPAGRRGRVLLQPQSPRHCSIADRRHRYHHGANGIVQDATGDDLSGRSSPPARPTQTGGSPTAVGQVASGERVIWPVTDGTPHRRYISVVHGGLRPSLLRSHRHPDFHRRHRRRPAAAWPTANAAITSASITGADAISDSGRARALIARCQHRDLNAAAHYNWASSLKLSLQRPRAALQDRQRATLHLTQSGCLAE